LEPGSNATNTPASKDVALFNSLTANSRDRRTSSWNSFQGKNLYDYYFINGRTWGGGTGVNYTASYRGTPKYWDSISTSYSAPRFAWKNMLPAFIANETFSGATDKPEMRGKAGPFGIRSSIYPATGTICNLIQNAAAATTTAYVPKAPVPVLDCNGGEDSYVSALAQFSQHLASDGKTWQRTSSATAYLGSDVVTPHGDGVNGHRLKVKSHATASRVLLRKNSNDESLEAQGVEYVQNNSVRAAYATKAVVLSAGVESSCILQRSGVGAGEDLVALNVPILRENPNVGHNFVMQPFLCMYWSCSDPSLVNAIFEDPTCFIMGHVVDVDPANEPFPRLYILGAPIPYGNSDKIAALNLPAAGVVTTLFVDANPRSTGSILATSKDVDAPPRISMPFFSDTQGPSGLSSDATFMVRCLQYNYAVIVNMRTQNPSLTFTVHSPAEALFQLSGPDTGGAQFQALYQYVLSNMVESQCHYGGTCRIGTSMANGVVDADLNVFGVDKLKVVDLSVLPALPNGNTGTVATTLGAYASSFV